MLMSQALSAFLCQMGLVLQSFPPHHKVLRACADSALHAHGLWLLWAGHVRHGGGHSVASLLVVVTRRAQGRWVVKYPEALGLESTCIVSPSMRTKDGNPMCGDLKLHILATSWTSHQGAIFCIAIPDWESQEEVDREGRCRT